MKVRWLQRPKEGQDEESERSEVKRNARSESVSCMVVSLSPVMLCPGIRGVSGRDLLRLGGSLGPGGPRLACRAARFRGVGSPGSVRIGARHKEILAKRAGEWSSL
jgi:hypothetical protein